MERDSEEIYEAIKPGYYHYAMLYGSPLQRFWHTNKFRKVIDAAGNLKDKRLLDLGCGPGSLISLLPRAYKSAVGVDFSKSQIDFAKKNFSGKNRVWLDKRIEELKFPDESFDIVFMIEVIEHLPKKNNSIIFSKARKLLKRGGRFIMTTPNYRSGWPIVEFFWNKVSKVNYEEQHINKFDIPKLRKELANAGFSRVEIRTFFIFSAFISIIWPWLAERIMEIEEKLFPQGGFLLLAEAEV